MQLSAFFPLYRNHNITASIAQEAYVGSIVADATRTVMQVRYSLLPYFYTLFYWAHTAGDTVMRAVAWDFPNEIQLAAIDDQFLLGPALFTVPVLLPQAITVMTVFPGLADGTIWYDWYALEAVQAEPGVNTTVDAPLGVIPLFVRGGSILPLQQPGNTTSTSRQSPFNLLVALNR